jgi:4-hydroxybenzoate polyprenyltransferase
MNGLQQLALAPRRSLTDGLTRLLVQSHLWVACAVLSLAAHAASRLGVASPGRALVTVFFSTLLIYNLDTSLDLNDHPESARARRARWLAGSCCLALMATLATGHLSATLLVVGGAFVCSLYAVPLPWSGRRLKDIPGTKSLFVGTSVAAAVVLVPVVYEGLPLTGRVLEVFSFTVTLTTVNATLFDVRDWVEDRQSGLASLPVLLGPAKTRLLLALTATVGFVGVAQLAPAMSVEAVACWALCVAFCLALSERSARSQYAWLVDGALFVPWLCSWVG